MLDVHVTYLLPGSVSQLLRVMGNCSQQAPHWKETWEPLEYDTPARRAECCRLGHHTGSVRSACGCHTKCQEPFPGKKSTKVPAPRIIQSPDLCYPI